MGTHMTTGSWYHDDGDEDDGDDLNGDDDDNNHPDDVAKVFHNETGHPSTNAFVAPSVTTYTDNNPEYRIYEVFNTMLRIMMRIRIKRKNVIIMKTSSLNIDFFTITHLHNYLIIMLMFTITSGQR